MTRTLPPVKWGNTLRDALEGEWEEGWEEWLHRYELYDATLSRDALYIRYLRLSPVTFGVVPRSEWGPFLRDLVVMEPSLVWGEVIGCAEKFPFRLQVEDQRPLRQKPIVYPRAEREWIARYVANMEALGLVERVRSGWHPDPVVTSSVVLVRGG